MPDYAKPFVLFCHECDACSLSVLTQVHGGVNRPVAYFSATLDPVAAALPGCLRAVAAVGQSLTQCEGIVMGHLLTVMVPHSVEILLTRTKIQHMTNARWTKYETIILGSPNVTLKRSTVLNPATLLPNENTEVEDDEDVEHDCLEVTEMCTKPRPDIKDTQLEENYQIIFANGSCLRDSVGVLRDGYAVCTISSILEASWLERVYSAQVAELVALPRACHAAAQLRVTIYTDSRYGFGIVHDFGQVWSQRGFLISSGSPVKNGERIKELLHVIQLPHEIAVVKCSAHLKLQDFVSKGNGYADQVARFCALNCISFKDQWELLPETENETCTGYALRVIDPLEELRFVQGRANKDEKHSWVKMQCVEATTLPPINDPGHNLKAGDWVIIKKHVRKSCLEPRWKGPYQVILMTTTAVKCVGILNWIHASHTKKVTCPTDEEVELLKVPTTEKDVSGPESDRRGTETVGEPVEDGLVTPVRDEGEETQRVDGEPISTEAPGEPDQREVLPEADKYGNELEPLTDPEGEGVEAEESQSVQTPPEQIAGPLRENTIESEGDEGLPQEISRTRETLKGGKWPELQVKKGKVVVEDAIEEEVDTTRREDLGEGELQGDCKLKRKRLANRRYMGHECAYATSAEWKREFLAFCFDREIPGQYFGT
ncbi:hypothetical protein NDU88_005840 [Pleurodeles waltl]|uniref:RNase H type-1 domain-containing protein n=1 Tax=Pleurodeles waltl TaxID=8319 RepID=A0AAV7QGC4_PLEWA|nr:hypothetical protein NDU88_005840 [Pleurodeles waltl]